MRVPVRDTTWARTLPVVPTSQVLTVTVNDASLAPVPVDDLIAGGYRIVGVAAPAEGTERCVDVLVPGELRAAHPAWWTQLRSLASHVFDLRMGPVRVVFGDELVRHLAAAP